MLDDRDGSNTLWFDRQWIEVDSIHGDVQAAAIVSREVREFVIEFEDEDLCACFHDLRRHDLLDGVGLSGATRAHYDAVGVGKVIAIAEWAPSKGGFIGVSAQEDLHVRERGIALDVTTVLPGLVDRTGVPGSQGPSGGVLGLPIGELTPSRSIAAWARLLRGQEIRVFGDRRGRHAVRLLIIPHDLP